MKTLKEQENKKPNFDLAEEAILRIADFIYAHMNLKPISKSIFFISRALMIMSRYKINSSKDLISSYEKFCSKEDYEIYDDYNFSEIVFQNKENIPHIINEIKALIGLLENDDDLTGKVFNSLLRGKYEAGEGMGTYLTPNEITEPMVEMVFSTFEKSSNEKSPEIADISGGTGRFLITAKNFLNKKGFKNNEIEKRLFSFDQSTLHTSLNKINFALFKMKPNIFSVSDSLKINEFKLNKKFDILITNPPFGKNKYKFADEIKENFPMEFLKKINFTKENHSIDPCELFLLKNLMLLKDGGVLGIILPDGLSKSNKIPEYINLFNSIYDDRVDLLAQISLPKETFSLTGTVALCSFLIFSKNSNIKYSGIFSKKAQRIGFKKVGNKKVYISDNDLKIIVDQFKNFLKFGNDKSALGNNYSQFVREYLKKKKTINIKHDQLSQNKYLNISILDVDNTGLLNINSALKNSPVTDTQTCGKGDILISCINPFKWRVLLVPDLPFLYTCSKEFLVLEAIKKSEIYKIYASLFNNQFKQQAIEISKGTSSSRQRIDKNSFMELTFQLLDDVDEGQIKKLLDKRNKFYLERLKEIKFFKKLSCIDLH